jgi:hypothetical protein
MANLINTSNVFTRTRRAMEYTRVYEYYTLRDCIQPDVRNSYKNIIHMILRVFNAAPRDESNAMHANCYSLDDA